MQNIPDVKNVLILCPKSVQTVWYDPVDREDEFSVHGALNFRLSLLNEGKHGRYLKSITTKNKAKNLDKIMSTPWPGPKVIIQNYEAAIMNELKESLMKVDWDMLILDESHKIKAPGSKISIFTSKLRKQCKRVVALTGTPFPNNFLDAYGQYRTIDPGIFGTNFTVHRARYAIMGGYEGRQVLGFQRQAEFNKKFYSIAYRVGKDVLDLPEFIHVRKMCDLGAKARKLYDGLENDFWAEVDSGEITINNALVKLLRLQQVAAGHVADDEGNIVQVGTEKASLCQEVLDDIAFDEPVATFCKFHEDLNSIERICKKSNRPYYELSGRVNQLSEWQKAKDNGVIAVQIQAGGIGVSLVRARYCIYYTVGFSLGDYQQSEARIHRPGQNRSVTYIHLITDNTVDKHVYRALSKKQKVIDSILGSRGKGN